MSLATDLLPALCLYLSSPEPLLRSTQHFMHCEAAWRAYLGRLREMNPRTYQDVLLIMPRLHDCIPRAINAPEDFTTPVFGNNDTILFHNATLICNPATMKSLVHLYGFDTKFSRSDAYMLLAAGNVAHVYHVETFERHDGAVPGLLVDACVNDSGFTAYVRNSAVICVGGREIPGHAVLDSPDGFVGLTDSSLLCITSAGDITREILVGANKPLFIRLACEGFAVEMTSGALFLYNAELTLDPYSANPRVVSYVKNNKVVNFRKPFKVHHIMQTRIIVRAPTDHRLLATGVIVRSPTEYFYFSL